MCTGKSASNLLQFKYDIIALQIDCNTWDHVLKAFPGTSDEILGKDGLPKQESSSKGDS